MMQELIGAVQETVQKHIFETADVLQNILVEKFHFEKEDITFETINGINTLTIKVPGGLQSVPFTITVHGEEVDIHA